jgi:prepilin-type N-terminal cleavage/methylation domain-containing protein
MKFASFRNQKGFSLVELMIVVGIIGILATLALPRFKQFQAKAKMGEAKNILSHLYTLQQTYSLDNNQYVAVAATGAALNASVGGAGCIPAANSGGQLIGFRLDPCTNGGTSPVPRYSYSVAAPTTSTFVASAVTGANASNRVCPGNVAHTVTINELNVLNEPSIGAACPN